MDLDKYLRDQLKILDGKPARYYGAVEKQQRRLYREISELLDQLQTNDAGQIITNTGNFNISEQINNRLRQAFYNEEYIESVNAFANGFDDAAELNRKWLSDVLGGELGADITGTADLLIQRQKRNAVELLVSTSAIDSAFFTPINNTLIESISTGESIKQLNRNIRNTILGTDKVDGRLLSYSKQIANDTISTGDRNYMFEMSKNVDIEFYRYSGGTISDTREFCQTRNGGYFHIKEIREWGTTPQNWQGRYRGTNPTTIFTWCGGYNCRHSLIPVSAASVPKEWLNRAIAKGYYKPTKAEQNELGVDRKTAKDNTKQVDNIGGKVKKQIKVNRPGGSANWDVYSEPKEIKPNKALNTKIQVDTVGNKLKTVKEQELRIGKLQKEELLVFDQNGKLLSRGKGSTYGVYSPNKIDDGYGIPEGSILTHNHPRAMIELNDPYGYGTAFSKNDIKLAHELKAREIRAVTGNAVHVFRRKDGTNMNPRSYFNISVEYDIADKQVREELTPLFEAGKISATDANYLHHNMIWEKLVRVLPAFEYFRYIRG